MFIKIYKRIHNRYINVFKYFFFLRYFLIIFLISLSLFVSIPKFFDYNKKAPLIKNFILQNYNLKIEKFGNIKFNVFPTPNLEVQNVILNHNLNDSKIKGRTLLCIFFLRGRTMIS